MNASTLIRPLRDLLQLTRAEALIARQRVAQARTDAVRRELTQNADNADVRADKIAREIRAHGGVPDVLTPALGRVAAMVKGVVEQGQPFDEALLSDLDLEHRLLARARYLKALAQAADDAAVRSLAEQLETAHSATVEWISTVLAEEALGGPAALRATPLQRVTGGITRLAGIPARYARDGANRALDNAARLRGRFGDAADRAVRIGRGAADVASTGVKASLGRAERVSRREGADGTADRLHDARRELGALSERELPIPDYDELRQQDAIARIKELDRPADVRAILHYEEAHKDRSSVVSAAQTRLAGIAKETTGIGR
jgi:bacterioferritin (cytochrome b1)